MYLQQTEVNPFTDHRPVSQLETDRSDYAGKVNACRSTTADARMPQAARRTGDGKPLVEPCATYKGSHDARSRLRAGQLASAVLRRQQYGFGLGRGFLQPVNTAPW
jgi:hypothetical protein